MMEQLELFEGVEIPPLNPNPMVRAFGRGPNGVKCRTCRYLQKKEQGKTYYKCQYRGDTNGPGTDHRVNWDACVLYKEATGMKKWELYTYEGEKKKILDTFKGSHEEANARAVWLCFKTGMTVLVGPVEEATE